MHTMKLFSKNNFIVPGLFSLRVEKFKGLENSFRIKNSPYYRLSSRSCLNVTMQVYPADKNNHQCFNETCFRRMKNKAGCYTMKYAMLLLDHFPFLSFLENQMGPKYISEAKNPLTPADIPIVSQ